MFFFFEICSKFFPKLAILDKIADLLITREDKYQLYCGHKILAFRSDIPHLY